jgi:PBS lyase HEAT-like repeat
MERTTLRLISCGRKAVSFLRGLLFQTDPSGIHEPRRWAVRALDRIGAHEVLIDFLNANHSCTDPVAQLGEEAVVNTAAGALAAVPSEEAYQALLRVAQWHPLAGAIEVLGQYRRPEVVPILIRALEDDLARSCAKEVLANFDESIGPALYDAATRKEPAADHESPSSLLRRRAAIRLLSDTRTASGFWNELSPLMRDGDPAVSVGACRIGLDCGNDQQKLEAARRLADLLLSVESALRSEIEDILINHYAMVHEIVEERVARQEAVSAARSLARIVSRAASRRTG